MKTKQTKSFFLNFIILTSLLLIFDGCKNNTSTNEIVVTSVPSKANVHVAFAGGGWRAHTGHTAWVISLLQANEINGCVLKDTSTNPQCLATAFANVKTVSGNSGGSWFSTMLMYDPTFVNQITGSKALQNWGTTSVNNPNQGWLGKQENYWSTFNSQCGSKRGPDYLECVLETYFSPSSIDPVPDWSQFVEKLVYKGYNWQAYGNLNSDTRQPWAKDKSLLMAGTWLTNAVVLNDNNDVGDEIYYQVCKSPNVVKTDGDDGSWCLNIPGGNKLETPDVLPVTFSSLAQNEPTLEKPGLIGTLASLYNLGYSSAYMSYGTTKYNTLQSGNIKTDNIGVMWASAASSAAAGYGASYRLNVNCSKYSTRWDCAYHLRNLALGFKVSVSTNHVDFVPNATLDNLSIDSLNSENVIRVADGGAIDNSGVAQLIGYLQLNNKDSNFEIIAFDDVQSDDASDKTKYPSSDISYMFEGAPSSGVCIKGVCVQVPELAILELDPNSKKPISKYTWTVLNGKNTDSLFYYSYEVQTVANPSFNIKGGSKGTIHVFASQFGCADTAPENNNDFACYNEMLKSFGTTLRSLPNKGTSTKNGYALLAEAFGL